MRHKRLKPIGLIEILNELASWELPELFSAACYFGDLPTFTVRGDLPIPITLAP